MRNARGLLLLAASLSAGCGGATTGPQGAAPPAARSRSAPLDSPRVVLVSIDGMRADYSTKADSYNLRIPNLRALMARGRYAEGMTSVFPTVTFPAHTTMVTGLRPATHGITTNLAFDPWMHNAGGWNWYAESIHGETLWQAAHRAGLTTGAIFWPVTVGAEIDFDVPQFWREKVDEDLKLLRAVSSPGFPADLQAHGLALPAEHRSDAERGAAGEYLLREKKPSLAAVYFGDLDSEEHRSGPGSKESLATLEAIDARLGKLVQATVDAGTYAQTTFLVVSDHGFQAVATETRPAAWLVRAGLVTRDASKHVTDWQAAALTAGGLSGIALRDPKDAALEAKVRHILRDLAADPANGIRRIYEKSELTALGGFGESSFALEAASGFEFVPGADEPAIRPSVHHGTHGYPPEDPEMRAAFLAAGPAIRPGAPIPNVRMIDVAPTVAKLLHLSLPHAEGQPIDALFAPHPLDPSAR